MEVKEGVKLEVKPASQHEVKHYVLDDTWLPKQSSTNGVLRDYNRVLVLEHPRVNFHFNFNERSELTPLFNS